MCMSIHLNGLFMFDGIQRSYNSDTTQKRDSPFFVCIISMRLNCLLLIFHCCSIPHYTLLAMTDSNDVVTPTFLSLLESFLVALMKSLRPWMYSSYSSSVMSPFSTSTCGRWGSGETHSELCHRHHCQYKAGGRLLKLKPSESVLWVLGCSLPMSPAKAALELKAVNATLVAVKLFSAGK